MLLLLYCALLVSNVASSSLDFPDLSSYSQPCEPFSCRPKRALAPVKDFEFTSNGCGTSGMSISSGKDFQECCDWHDACYSVCGMPKANCEKRFQKCMKVKCREIRSQKKREECMSTAKVFYIGANMVGCSAFEDAQKEACECVPADVAAFATHERVKYFLKENGAPDADVEEEAIDALLEKYKGDEPTMFLRLLKKYPKALKTDLTKTNYMDDIVKNTDKSIKKKKKKGIQIEKEVPVEEHEEL
ncbi:unnamed protein product [Peronospora destructor]|uniref:Phospholipase A2 n=1 Tax=Peronospora destructor TaxID=86335 RepID=A0AAV0TQE3_9STRA|nr:unnamed protein product [Peronospora destructor]